MLFLQFYTTIQESFCFQPCPHFFLMNTLAEPMVPSASWWEIFCASGFKRFCTFLSAQFVLSKFIKDFRWVPTDLHSGLFSSNAATWKPVFTDCCLGEVCLPINSSNSLLIQFQLSNEFSKNWILQIIWLYIFIRLGVLDV